MCENDRFFSLGRRWDEWCEVDGARVKVLSRRRQVDREVMCCAGRGPGGRVAKVEAKRVMCLDE